MDDVDDWITQVVLNLANSEWPPPDPTSFANCSMLDEHDVLPTGAAANLHRIRALLARGKAVLSEVSGVGRSAWYSVVQRRWDEVHGTV